MLFISLLASLPCAFFFIFNKKTSLGEVFIMDVSSGLKFQPRIIITSMDGEKVTSSDVHKIQQPRKCWANDLSLYPGNVQRTQVEPVGKKAEEIVGKMMCMHFIQVIPPLLCFSAISLCVFSH